MHIIILAGGGGTRLWPFSRLDYPKQFLHFGDQFSLLQKTVRRCLSITESKKIVIITNVQYESLVQKQISEVVSDGCEISVIVEPDRKNTAPAIVLGVKYLEGVCGVKPHEKVLVLPSDHLISPEEKFVKTIENVKKEDLSKSILVFGVKPTEAETGYGYIQRESVENASFSKVIRFVEKPKKEKAEEFLKDKDYFWNSGMFCFSIKTFWTELSLHAQALFEKATGSYEQVLMHFSKMPNISIDYALMEQTQCAVMLALDVEWSDVGSWDSLYKVLDKDHSENVKVGNILDIDTTNSLIIGSKRLISTIGLDDMLIVETEDALFLAKKGKSQQVKELVEALRKQGHEETSFAERWMKKTENYSVRICTINPKNTLIIPTSDQKTTIFEILSGKGHISVKNRNDLFSDDNRIKIEEKTEVLVENHGPTPLEVLHIERVKVDDKQPIIK